MTARPPGWLWLATALASGLFLSACSVSVNFGNGPSSHASVSPKGSTSPHAPASSTTKTVTLPVTQLPTENAAGSGSPIDYPASTTFTVPRALASQVAAYGVAGVVVLGPSGWTGTDGLVGADTSAGFTLYPAVGSSSGGPQMTFLYDGGCVGCSWSDAAAYFPTVAASPLGQGVVFSTPVPGLVTDNLGPGLIAYSRPASVPTLQTNGVALTTLPGQDNDTVAAVFENLSLTLSATEHPLATVILNAFLDNEDRYVCSAVGSPTVSLLLQGSALGSIGPACG